MLIILRDIVQCIETVNHYLTECPLFTNQRNKLRRKLCDISDHYKDEQNFQAMDILFPFRWQINPIKDDHLAFCMFCFGNKILTLHNIRIAKKTC